MTSMVPAFYFCGMDGYTSPGRRGRLWVWRLHCRRPRSVHSRASKLGRAFSVQAKASTLVTSGIYARIRNPIYVFAGLFIAGLILFAHRPWGLLIFVVYMPVQLLGTRKEHRLATICPISSVRRFRAWWPLDNCINVLVQ
jgi:hypothetical protein